MSAGGRRFFREEDVNGKYECLGTLGKGSYGYVWVAAPTGPSEHTKVAIKNVKGIFNNHKEARRMLRELRLLRKLSACDNIVGIIDILPPRSLEEFNSLFIALEYVTSDLGKLLRTSQFWEKDHVTWILHQILLGVKFMHSAKICHRDLKPANILVNREKCCICDFGLARSWMVNSSHEPNPWSNDRVSSGATSCVTPVLRAVRRKYRTKDWMKRTPTRHVVTRWYRSPEIILEEQDWEHMGGIDIWSVGCIMAELMNMDEGNCPALLMRKALFPGSSSYPLSPRSSEDDVELQNTDQLEVIFKVIGTPTEEEIDGFTKHEVKKRLEKFGKNPGQDFRLLFPVSPDDHVDLLKKLIMFDRRKRFTVEQALAHEALQHWRKPQQEQVCEPEVFEFENHDLSTDELRDLLVEEVLLYNPNLSRQYADRSKQKGLPRSGSRDSLPDIVGEMCELESDQDIMAEDDSLLPPTRMTSFLRSDDNAARSSKSASDCSDSYSNPTDKPQSLSPSDSRAEEEKNEHIHCGESDLTTSGEESNLSNEAKGSTPPTKAEVLDRKFSFPNK